MSLKAPTRPSKPEADTKTENDAPEVVTAKPRKFAGPVAKLQEVKRWVNTQVVGRQDVADAVVLAVAARQNVCMIGVPGTGKTMVVQQIAQSFADQPGDVFDIMLTKFTKPAEVFGPPDLNALEHGEYRYVTDGYLPKAKVGILDEMFKGSSAIMNALLRIANERTFKNGNIDEKTPVRMMVGMSNEFPEEPALLAAYFDRYPIKLLVKSLESDDFQAMLQLVADASPTPVPCKLTDADFKALDALVDACEVSADVVDSLAQLREMLKAKSVILSDRRFAQSVRVLKAYAVLEGRDKVSLNDFEALGTVLWNSEPEIAILRAILPDFVNPFEKDIQSTIDDVYAEQDAVIAAANIDGADKDRAAPDFAKAAEVAGKAISRVRTYMTKLQICEEGMEGQDDARLTALLKQSRESITEIDKVFKAILTGKPNAIRSLLEFKRPGVDAGTAD